MPRPDSLPIRRFASEQDWAAWLERNHGRSPGLWLRIAKKGANVASVSYPEALDVALCYGWIDGQKRPQSDTFWLQKSARARKRVSGRASTARKRSPSSRPAGCDRPGWRRSSARSPTAAGKALQTAKKAETRARRRADFLTMLERGRKIHEVPRKRKSSPSST